MLLCKVYDEANAKNYTCLNEVSCIILMSKEDKLSNVIPAAVFASFGCAKEDRKFKKEKYFY